MKVVINACFGGFGLSPLAQIEIAKRKKIKLHFYNLFGEKKTQISKKAVLSKSYMQWYSDFPDISRTDPDLIAAVEGMGKSVNSPFAELKVVEIPDGIDWEISEYDGRETIEEAHRSWD